MWIRSVLTFDVPGAKYSMAYKRGQWDGKKRMFDIRTGVFPIGLLSYVLRSGKLRKIDVVDNRKFPKVDQGRLELNTIDVNDPDRHYQLKAIDECIANKNCLIEAATNAGKTAIFSGLIKKLAPAPTLVLTHRSELLKQTVEYIERYTGLKCGFITAKDILIRPVTVAMITTLVNRLGADQEVDDYFKSLQCVIQDEVHHAQAAQFTAVLEACPAPYRWGFSGTVPPANEYNGVLVRQFLGDVVYKISNDELIALDVSAKPKIFMYEMDVSSQVRGVIGMAKAELEAKDELYSGQQLMKKVYEMVVKLGIVQNSERNGKAVEIIKNNPGKSTLIVVDYLEHGEIVEQLLSNNGISSVFISGKAAHRAQALSDFKAGKLQILISTNIIDEGIDISRIEVLILLAGKKSRRQLLQRIGRSLRRKEGENVVSVYDFCDHGNKYLLKHSKERMSIYKQEQFEVEFC